MDLLVETKRFLDLKKLLKTNCRSLYVLYSSVFRYSDRFIHSSRSVERLIPQTKKHLKGLIDRLKHLISSLTRKMFSRDFRTEIDPRVAFYL